MTVGVLLRWYTDCYPLSFLSKHSINLNFKLKMKNQNFVVEVINDGSRIYVIRDLQGRVVKVCQDPESLAQFFADIEFKV